MSISLSDWPDMESTTAIRADLDIMTDNSSCFPKYANSTREVKHGWWCDQEEEYAFLGFSYDVSMCPSADHMHRDFLKMKNEFSARYVRIYSACDEDGFNDRLVNTATDAGLGIYALIWFGFEGDDQWRYRKADLLSTIKRNRNATYVIRNVALGSEPLFDSVMSVSEMTKEINILKKELNKYDIEVTLSEMPYGFEKNNNAPDLFKSLDILEANVLPFFAFDATTGSEAWANVKDAVRYFKKHGNGKIIRITQTGWPSNDIVWKANSRNAIASIDSEKEYYDLLDKKCTFFKNESIGWFAHIWDDDGLPGWGILDGGKTKFEFNPRTSC